MRQATSKSEKLSPQEREAVARLYGGSTFAAAMEGTGLTYEEVAEAWRKRQRLVDKASPRLA